MEVQQATQTNCAMAVFQIGTQCYAIDIHAIIEVTRLPALTPIHGSAPYICGMLNWHGQFLPVLDGYHLVGEGTTTDLTSQLIVLGRMNPQGLLTPVCALLVTSVDQVTTIPMLALNRLTAQAAAPYMDGVFQYQGAASVILLNTDQLFQLANMT